MKYLWYNIVKSIVKVGLFFTHKKIKVFGTENIPKEGAIIFIGNHQNALIDAILIPTTTSRNIHFLTRASVFKTKIVDKILRSLNLIPVYRLRDGKENMEKNIAVFNQCFEYLKAKKAIQIFAEGEHHLFRRILPLKKGFARIILGTLQKYPDLEIKIVPVGINYDSHLNFPSSVSIYYGKPILANPYFNVENPDITFKHIINKVSSELKQLTTHIEDVKKHDEIIKKLTDLNIDFLNPIETNNTLKNLSSIIPTKKVKKEKINWFTPIHILTKINSFFPLLIWRYLQPKIKDIIFTNTYRFALIMTVFPLFYTIQAGIISVIFNYKYGLAYLLFCIITGIITTKTTTVTP
ncbi:lysophospholipid acyltransferase family protein [Lutibacter sp. A64]|uniref:lysophospholipid acyltransferase family protein n=1 Tax=Lutibacter sp. A64 TaxID=2918526 RepID=UPI001F0646FB|nr:lysophospholipid acyltransferase family protein [Lutibacter sp. A64]UMB54252.1 lysophospholipid acyltransferase family protein [Lutibacter sp. A64]